MRTRGYLRFPLCLAVLLASGAARAQETGAPQASKPSATTVSLEVLKTRHLAVQVKINDQGPFRMVLDTGSPLTFVSTDLARRLGIAAGGSGDNPVFGMRFGVKLRSVALGEATVRDLPVMVLDHPTVEMLAQVNGPLEGIVGLNVLSRFRSTIDYEAGELMLTPVDYQPRDVVANLMGQLMARESGKTYVSPAALWGVVVEKPDTKAGVRVARVYEGSPAAAAGLRLGDRILTVDRRWTDTVTDCLDAASLAAAGRSVPVHILRAGAPRDLVVKPAVGL